MSCYPLWVCITVPLFIVKWISGETAYKYFLNKNFVYVVFGFKLWRGGDFSDTCLLVFIPVKGFHKSLVELFQAACNMFGMLLFVFPNCGGGWILEWSIIMFLLRLTDTITSIYRSN